MKPVWVAKKSSSTDAEKEKSLEEDQTPKTSRLGVGDIGNPSAQVPITTLSYMLKGSARMAGVKPAPEPSAPPSSSIGVDGASDAVQKFPSSATVGSKGDYIEGEVDDVDSEEEVEEDATLKAAYSQPLELHGPGPQPPQSPSLEKPTRSNPQELIGEAQPPQLIEMNPEWQATVASYMKLKESKAKGKKTVQAPSAVPKRSLRTNKGQSSCIKCLFYVGM